MDEKLYLTKNLQRLTSIIDASGLGTWEYNAQTKSLVYNEHWASMIGYQPDELQPVNGSLWQGLLHPADQDGASAKLLDCISGKSDHYEIELRLRHKNGAWVWILDKGKVVSWTADGQAEWLMGSHQDITAKKNNELLLERYEQLFQKTKEVAQIGTWELDLLNHIFSWDAVTRNIYGVDADYVPSFEKDNRFFGDGAYASLLEGLIEKSIRAGGSFDREILINTGKSNKRWVRMIGTPYFENGVCERIYGFVQDIHQKNETVHLLALQEEQFRQTFDFAPNGMALVSADGKWLRVNTSLCDLVGYTAEELLRISFQDITHPDDLHEDMAYVTQMLIGERNSYTMEKRYFHKSGDIIWASLSVSIVRSKEGDVPLYFVSQITDISKEKLLQINLTKSNLRMQGILDASTQVGIMEMDHLGVIQLFNCGAENLLGYQAVELVKKRTPEAFLTEEQLAARRKDLSEQTGKLLRGFELISYRVKQAAFETVEWTFVRKNETQFTARVTITAVRDQHQEVTGYLILFFDITELKVAEREVHSLLSVTQQQNKKLLNFANIVSHNLRSHAGNIDMLLDMIRQEQDQASDSEYFPLLTQASKNLLQTIGNLHEVVHLGALADKGLESVNLADYIRQSVGNLRAYLLEAGATVLSQIGERIRVLSVPAYLESIIVNILSNAIKYRSPHQKLVIDITTRIEKEFLVVTIKDNGLGIDLEKNGDQLFGLFKTFHGNQDARGMGLYLTKSHMETMGGRIEAQSEPGVGTSFLLYFPVLPPVD